MVNDKLENLVRIRQLKAESARHGSDVASTMAPVRAGEPGYFFEHVPVLVQEELVSRRILGHLPVRCRATNARLISLRHKQTASLVAMCRFILRRALR